MTRFVILGAMRTGSNLLERTLDRLEGVTCHGELFNPHFIGREGTSSAFGLTLADREARPLDLLAAAQTADLTGFRMFAGHDPRVLDHLLADRDTAKIVLSRDPLDSFVSLEIARATGQWMLGHVTRRRAAKIRFDPEAWERHRATEAAFRARIERGLQTTGQSAFRLDYTDLRDRDVINGLAAWLGIAARFDKLPEPIRRQNPEPLEDLVENPGEMFAAAGLRPTQATEPAPSVPLRRATSCGDLMFLPVPGAPDEAVRAALSARGTPEHGFDRSRLAARLGAVRVRSFTVVRHPLLRAYHVFCTRILPTGPGSFAAIRRQLRALWDVDLPEALPDPSPAALAAAGVDAAAQRRAFTGFLRFLKANLAGQTSQRTDPSWLSQAALIGEWARHVPVQRVLYEGAAEGFGDLGLAPPDPPDHPIPLAEIHTERLERLSAKAFARDHAQLGFGPWRT